MQEIRHNDLMEYLRQHLNFTPRVSDIASICGHKITQFYKLPNLTGEVCENAFIDKVSDLVSIKYMHIPGIPAEVLQSPYIEKQLRFDRELVQNNWQRDPDCQRIVRMRGDKMDGGSYPLKNNDILMIDISKTSIIESAVYIYTTCFQQQKEVFISRVNIRPDGNVRISYDNPNYNEIIYTPEQIKQMNFECHGRIVKNLSMTI